MKTLPMFDQSVDAPVATPPREKPTTITIQAGSGRHISARSLFTHLRDALEGCDLSGITTLTIGGDGSVSVDGETVYRPRQVKKAGVR